MNHSCGAGIAPGDTLCPGCLNPLIWAGDQLEGMTTPKSHSSLGRTVEADPAPAPPIPCSCGRSHPLDTTCAYGGVSMEPHALAAPEVMLPGALRVAFGAVPLLLGRLADDARIGRALDDDFVSRRHATIRFDGVNAWIADCGSMHGTWLGGRRIEREERLRHGAVDIRLGTRVTITVSTP